MVLGLLRRLFYDEPEAHVQMYCPETGEVVATEHTDPDGRYGQSVLGYYCERCDANHVFLWGPPAPVYIRDEPADR